MEDQATLPGRHNGGDIPESDARLASSALSSCILPGTGVSAAAPLSPANAKLCAFCAVTLTRAKRSACLPSICTAHAGSCEAYQVWRGFAKQQTDRQVHHLAWLGCW